MEVAATLLGRPHVLAAQVEPAAGTGSAGEAMLPVTMCRLAAGGYRGAIGHPGRARDWTPGVLVVSADAGASHAGCSGNARPGPAACPPGPSCCGSTPACVSERVVAIGCPINALASLRRQGAPDRTVSHFSF